MTTVEKLLVQIFERKNSIIEQVKQQTELYIQHQASKLLIDGITPPAWLFSPDSSDSKELNKEVLISKLIRPHPQPSVRGSVAHFSVYNNPVPTGDNEESSDRSFIKNLAFSNVLNRQDDPTVPTFNTEDVAECVLNTVPELDVSVISPESQADDRILNIPNAPEQSLARIQRSKSRQKALELRSAKALAKSGPSQENKSDSLCSNIRFSLSATNQAEEKDALPKLAEPCLIGTQSCEGGGLDEADHLDKGKEMNTYSGRITRSGSYAKGPGLARGSLTVGCFSGDLKDSGSSGVAKVRNTASRSTSTSTSEQPDNYVNTLPQSAGTSTVCCENYGNREVDAADCLSKEREIDVYSGKIPSSKNSSKCRSGSKADISPDGHQRNDIARMDPRNNSPIYGSLLRANSSNVLDGLEAQESMQEDCKSSRETCLSNHKEIDVYTGGVLSSKIYSKSQSCAHDSSNEDYQTLYTSMMEVGSGSDLPFNRSPVRDNSFNVLNEDFGARESMSEDCNHDKERSSVPSSSYSQYNDCVAQACGLDESCQPGEADGDIPAPLSGRSAQHVNDSNEEMGLVKPPSGSFRRVTRSQTWHSDKEYRHVDIIENPSCGGTLSKSHSKQKPATNELQNISSGQAIPPSYGTHDTFDENENDSSIMSTELASHGCVDKFGSSRSSDSKQRNELETQVAPPADSFAFVDSNHLGLKQIEEVNLKAFTSNSGKRRLIKSPEKISCSSSGPTVSQDRGMSLEARRGCFGFDVRGNPDSEAEKFEHLISSEDNIEVELRCNVSEVHQEADNVLSKMVDVHDLQIHPLEVHGEHAGESLPEQQIEEGNQSVEEKAKGELMSLAPESENLRSHHNSGKEPRAEACDHVIGEVESIVLEKIKPVPVLESQTSAGFEGQVSNQHADSSPRDDGKVTCSTVRYKNVESFSPGRRCRQASMESWPQLKRRKVEQNKTQSFPSSPSFRSGVPHSNEKGPASMSVENMDVNMDTVLLDRSGVSKSTSIQIHRDLDFVLREGNVSSFPYQNEEVQFCPNEKNVENNSSVSINEQLGKLLVSNLANETRDSSGCSIEGMGINQFEARESGDGQCSQDLCNLDFEDLNLTSKVFEGMESPGWEGDTHIRHSVFPPSDEQPGFIDVDQSMPVFEGFFIDSQADNDDELDLEADGIDLNRLNLPTTAIERASILAEICRSASLNTPLTHFSSGFRYQGTENLFHSVPNGRHESLNLGDSHFEVDKQLQSDSSLADDYKNAFEGMLYSESLAYSSERHGWGSKDRQGSPIGNLWERLSSHTGSSEKRSISNPELTCFPIEEDPTISEENRAMDENADDVQEEIDSSSNHRDKRQALKDLTNLGLSPTTQASAKEEILRADSLHFMNTKLSVTGTEDKVQPSLKNQYRGKSKRDKQVSTTGAKSLSIGTNGTRKTKESINNSVSKPNKAGLKKEDQKLSLKEARRNNIVSNCSSFIPLVQQKQEAPPCAGKRDVKVKALEAAEAAKRLAEKRENERKMRKEALKVERAKLEEKNLRTKELEKKQKEEERKKKEADIIARKRLREEEGRKEKEKKRIRLEARQHQREQEDKMRAEKAEKEKQRSKDEQTKSKKKSRNEIGKQRNMEMVRGHDLASKKTEAKLTTAEVVMSREECSTSTQSCEAGKALHTVDKSPKPEDLIVQNNQGKSYDISPYQCSDDEDDESDELPTKKHVPSWASKGSVALLLPLQQGMDPDVIFPPGRFCSKDEVLLPRKLQQKQVAT